MHSSIAKLEIFATICVGLSLRSIVSLYSYSGAGSPPIYGDYEAQRHWQEITVNLNMSEWYKNGTNNNLLYWGLDYPPLTAYHSNAMGRLAKLINPDFVALVKSQGYESHMHKSFMRFTVLLADILIYFPAIYTVCKAIELKWKMQIMLPLLLLFITFPGQILIDNGHFQYNNISLGLAAFAIAAVIKDKHILATIFFSLSLNYKQMELYHSLPFFSYLLKISFNQKSFFLRLLKFSLIAGGVISTFAIVWFPWIHSLDAMSNILLRLFPLGRGIFEDKVSNFWCALNVVYKVKNHFSNDAMAILCLLVTLTAVTPININLFIKSRKDNFILSLLTTSLAFFLFSFQVHEKSILLATLPACCFFGWKPIQVLWFLQVSTFSMFPLLSRDQLVIPFFTLLAIFHLTFNNIYLKSKRCYTSIKGKNRINILNSSLFVIVVCTFAYMFIPAPKRFPYLWSLIISLVCCAQFIIFFILCSYHQLYNSNSTKSVNSNNLYIEKKLE